MNKLIKTILHYGRLQVWFSLLLFAFISLYSSKPAFAITYNTPTTTITGTTAATIYGTPVTFSSIATDSTTGGDTPTGSVTFKDGSTTLGTVGLAPTDPIVSTASGGPPQLPSGDTVSCYSGPGTSTSVSCPVLVWGDITYWVFSYSDNRYSFDIVGFDKAGNIIKRWEKTGSRYLWQISLDTTAKTVTFSGQSGGTPVTMSWSALEDANASASYTVSNLLPGTHSITAVYSGDTNHAANSSAAAFVETVSSLPSSISVTSSTNPNILGLNTNLTATVTTSGDIPTGTVTFSDGGTAIGTASLQADSTAVLSTLDLTIGSHSITAAYTGDSIHAASTSAVWTQYINIVPTTASVSSAGGSSIDVGTTTTFTTTVTSTAGSSIPQGSILLKDNGTSIATPALTPPVLQPFQHRF